MVSWRKQFQAQLHQPLCAEKPIKFEVAGMAFAVSKWLAKETSSRTRQTNKKSGKQAQQLTNAVFRRWLSTIEAEKQGHRAGCLIACARKLMNELDGASTYRRAFIVGLEVWIGAFALCHSKLEILRAVWRNEPLRGWGLALPHISFLTKERLPVCAGASQPRRWLGCRDMLAIIQPCW